MAVWTTGKVVGHQHWSESLHTLYVDAAIEPFEAGQFVKIGLNINEEVIGHPYSLVNAPNETPLAFYYIKVANGKLTPHLVELKTNDSILIAPKAHGFLILDEIPITKELWLMATGTGIGPFLSMLATNKPWQRYKKIILVWAVRTLSELTYQDFILKFLSEHPLQLIYIPFVSREVAETALSGRIPQAIIDGRLEKRAGTTINAKDSQIERGLRKHKRFSSGHISSETYW